MSERHISLAEIVDVLFQMWNRLSDDALTVLNRDGIHSATLTPIWPIMAVITADLLAG